MRRNLEYVGLGAAFGTMVVLAVVCVAMAMTDHTRAAEAAATVGLGAAVAASQAARRGSAQASDAAQDARNAAEGSPKIDVDALTDEQLARRVDEITKR